MQILEQCITAWPMRDLQAQVHSLREAFSADINKPFQLKPSFPFASPMTRLAPSPSSDTFHQEVQTVSPAPSELKPQMAYHQQPVTPPISAGLEGQHVLRNQPLQPLATGQQLGEDGLPQWNPTRLFEYGAKSLKIDTSFARKLGADLRKSQWSMAFGTPTSTVPSVNQLNPNSPAALYSPAASTVGSTHEIPHTSDPMSGHSPQHFSLATNMPSTTQMQAPTTYAPQAQQLVSPAMWRDTVASTYVSNDLKRRWDGVSGPAWHGEPGQQQQVACPVTGSC